MKKIIMLSLVFSTLGFTKVLIEPYVGVNILGDFDYKSAAVNAAKGKSDKIPFTLGGRLGYTKIGFQVGLDGALTKAMKFDQNTAQKGDLTEFGAFVGYELPILLRGYVGYTFLGKIDFETGGKFEKLQGVKFGVGYSIYPFIKLNLEYKLYNFGKYELSAGSVNPSADADLKMFAATISIPFKL